jgi:hypothetical protein
MPKHSIPKNSKDEKGEKAIASDYVLMEAELIAGTSKKTLYKANKTILIYSWSHDLLIDISNELKAVLESDVEILFTTDSLVAHRLLISGEIDLLLHGPFSSNLLSVLEKEQEESLPVLGSALVLLHSSNKEIESWINHPDYSMHLTNAITRLNRSRNV